MTEKKKMFGFWLGNVYFLQLNKKIKIWFSKPDEHKVKLQ